MNPPLSAGTVLLGRYKIKDVIRPRLLSWAYRAYDREIEVDVQLDAIHAELAPTPMQREDLIGRARKAARLTHRHIRRIYEAHAAPPGQTWSVVVASQLLEGPPLQRPGPREAGATPRPLHYLRGMASQIGEALVGMHAVGIVHGCLRPDEITVLSDVIKVGGAGLAGALDRKALFKALEAGSNAGGDLRYLAPEVRGGYAIDERGDVYAFGVVMLEQALGVMVDDPLLGLGMLEERAPRLKSVLERALSEDPKQRGLLPAVLAASIEHALADDVANERGPGVVVAAMTPGRSAHDDEPTRDFERVDAQEGDPDFPGDDDNAVTPPIVPVSPPPRRPPLSVPMQVMQGAIEPKRQNGHGLDLPPARVVFTAAETQPGAALTPEPLILPPVPPPPPPGPPQSLLPPDPPAPPPWAPVGRSATPTAVVDPHAPMSTSQRMTTMPVRSYNSAYALTPRRSRAPLFIFLGILLAAIVGAVFVARKLLEHKSGEHPSTLPIAKGGGQPKPPVEPPSKPVKPVKPDHPVKPVKPDHPVAVAVAAVDAAVPVAVPHPASAPDAGAGMIVTRPIEPASSGPCPAGAKLDGALCIDSYEAPGQSVLPTTNISWGDARKACSARGMRLCKAHEWEAACRGAHGASYPYGASFYAPKCNVERSGNGKLLKTGSMPECISGAGLYDMAGNVAEWVDEGYTKGGSWQAGEGRCSKADHPARDEGHADVGYRCCGAPR